MNRYLKQEKAIRDNKIRNYNIELLKNNEDNPITSLLQILENITCLFMYDSDSIDLIKYLNDYDYLMDMLTQNCHMFIRSQVSMMRDVCNDLEALKFELDDPKRYEHI